MPDLRGGMLSEVSGLDEPGHQSCNEEFHAVVVGDILTINSYTPPDEERIVTQLSHIESFFEKQQ